MYKATPEIRTPAVKGNSACLVLLTVLLLAQATALPDVGTVPTDGEEPRFVDDFEAGLNKWELEGAHAVSVVDSGDPAHKQVLELRADGLVWALVRGSDR